MTALLRMPHIPEPPHDPTSLLLAGWLDRDVASGFRGRVFERIDATRVCRTLTLAPAPDATRFMTEPSGSFGGLRTPFNVAVAADGAVFLLEPVTGQLLRFDACDCRFVAVPCFTRVVTAPLAATPARPIARNLLSEPHGIALRHDEILIADSGHARVLRYTRAGFIARGELRLPKVAAAERGRAWYPFALVFDSRGNLFVSDPPNKRIDEFDCHGRWRRSWVTDAAPWSLAVDDRDRLHALLAEADGVDSTPGSNSRWVFREVPGVPLAPRVVRFVDGAAAPAGVRSDLAEDFAVAPLQVDAEGFLTLPCARGRADFDARGRETGSDRRVLRERFQRSGRFETVALDARLEGCQWHRVELRGLLPGTCRVSVRTLSAHVELDADELAALPDTAWSIAQVASAFAANPDDARWDCLISSPPGRYLWLRLEFSGDGHATPQICAVVVEFPRVSLRRFLPGVFGADAEGADFTDRFMAIFDTTLRSIERQVDRLAENFDPLSAPARAGASGQPDFLSWIASWIGLTLVRDLPLDRQRHFVKQAAALYARRGTPGGLRDQLLLLLGFDLRLEECRDERPRTRCLPAPLNCGLEPERRPAAAPPLLLEHFRLRRWLFAGRGRLGDDSVLWGSSIVNRSQLSGNAEVGVTQLKTVPDPWRDPLHVHAHRFSVFVPARVREVAAERRAFEQLLGRETPAHAVCDIHYVEPRFRVGRQAMIGLDSVIARTPAGVRLDANRLGQGTILTAPPGGGPGPGLRVGDTRVGTTTVLE
jgi:phage tail-like protein